MSATAPLRPLTIPRGARHALFHLSEGARMRLARNLLDEKSCLEDEASCATLSSTTRATFRRRACRAGRRARLLLLDVPA
ncbi:hypothetical protein K2X14_14555 [Acetobacter sp. TBRC 12305]|uniref:Uncharacterized protein n=1 Tax=Acetobacter garciniae TaxID=2817435 RepID=A0A939HRB0_9PROT|nr:hypothetical protein [Acetobacter garciniae]MBO1326206.1 hypothetical protein [Acetobacter garciniae]MBX0346057.1 hypothetical protein [Acetobacter garciniae]